MLAPAGLYLMLAGGPATQHGWGVPMATDIAFAVGVLALLGPRVPPALRVLLLALAVIDDLGAIIVIALFYSSNFSLVGLFVAACGVIVILLMQRLGVRAKGAYVAPALVCWGGVYAAGIHPTIAGVIVGVMTPVRAWLGPERFAQGVHRELEALPNQESPSDLARSLQTIDVARREAISPAESLIDKLHPWVAYAIMPLFALANAGVAIGDGEETPGRLLVTWGVAVGLVFGKPLGVMFAIFLTTRLRLAELPRGIAFKEVLVLGMVAGIGFTMALFVAQLAFSDAGLLQAAKQGILMASFAAGLGAIVVGRFLMPERCDPAAATTADQAEQSDHL
jgi:NhaA family Na+:H+ antiporter